MSFYSIVDKIENNINDIPYIISPILLKDGIASNMGGLIPIILFTEKIDRLDQMILDGVNGELNIPSIDSFWCHWKQAINNNITQNNIIQNTLPQNSFTDITSAGNAFSNNVAKISMQMMCPARGVRAMETKRATLTALQKALTKHNCLGGCYIIITPSGLWTDMILQKISDITPNPEKFPSSLYQFDFQRPIFNRNMANKVGDRLRIKYENKTKNINSMSKNCNNLAEKIMSGMGII